MGKAWMSGKLTSPKFYWKEATVAVAKKAKEKATEGARRASEPQRFPEQTVAVTRLEEAPELRVHAKSLCLQDSYRVSRSFLL